MNKERLLKLADYMASVPAHKLEMDTWISEADYEGAAETIKKGIRDVTPDGTVTSDRKFEIFPEGYCGTVCCVLGHATFIPEFREAGLRNHLWVDKSSVESLMNHGLYDYGPEVGFRDDVGHDAAAAFFDIPWQDACVLFGTWSSSWRAYGRGKTTPEDVARGIRRYVEEGAFWNQDEGKDEDEE